MDLTLLTEFLLQRRPDAVEVQSLDLVVARETRPGHHLGPYLALMYVHRQGDNLDSERVAPCRIIVRGPVTNPGPNEREVMFQGFRAEVERRVGLLLH